MKTTIKTFTLGLLSELIDRNTCVNIVIQPSTEISVQKFENNIPLPMLYGIEYEEYFVIFGNDVVQPLIDRLYSKINSINFRAMKLLNIYVCLLHYTATEAECDLFKKLTQ